MFDNEFEVVDWRVVGERHLKLSLRLDGSLPISAIHFGAFDGSPPAARLQLAYQLEPDDHRSGQAVQLMVRHSLPG